MSWSLQIANGDLVIGSGGLNTVTGGAKLVQDLGCALLTPMGTDPMHPTYGSLIDGGVDATGKQVNGVIGSLNDDQNAAFVGAEVQRICRSYQASQIARNNADVATYGKSTLTADEALLGVESINVQQVEDQVLITATIQTGVGGLPVSVPIST